MKLLPRQLRTEHHQYVSIKPIEQIRTDFNTLFTDRYLELELTGKFTNENKFLLYNISSFFFSQRVPGPLLRGIVSTKDNQTVFNVSVVPGSGHFVFLSFIVPGLFGLLGLIFNPGAITVGGVVVCMVFTFVMPAASAFYTQVSKDRMREKFEKYFGLKDNVKQ